MGQRRSLLEAAALAKARWRRARRAQISFRKSWRLATTIVATTLLARAFALDPRLAVAGRRLPRDFVDGTDEGGRWTLVLAISPAAVASLLLVRRHVLAGEAFARPVIASPSPLRDAFGQLPAVDGPGVHSPTVFDLGRRLRSGAARHALLGDAIGAGAALCRDVAERRPGLEREGRSAARDRGARSRSSNNTGASSATTGGASSWINAPRIRPLINRPPDAASHRLDPLPRAIRCPPAKLEGEVTPG